MKRNRLLPMATVFCTVLFFSGCDLTGSDTSESTPVTVPDGTILITDLKTTSMTLFWTAAGGSGTLKYRAYYSESDNIGTVEEMKMNGIAVDDNWTTEPSAAVTDLTKDKTYYFNVMVTNEAGSTAAYTERTKATPSVNDTIAPHREDIFISENPGGLFVQIENCRDNETAGYDLQFLIYYSEADNMNTLEEAKANGSACGTWTTAVSLKEDGDASLSVSKPDAGKYYIAAIIRDEAGNETLDSLSKAITITNDSPLTDRTITASKENNTVTLTWIPVPPPATDSIMNYLICYSDTGEKVESIENALVAEDEIIQLSQLTGNASSYTTPGLTAGETYYFNVIVQINSKENSSIFMDIYSPVSVTIDSE